MLCIVYLLYYVNTHQDKKIKKINYPSIFKFSKRTFQKTTAKSCKPPSSIFLTNIAPLLTFHLQFFFDPSITA